MSELPEVAFFEFPVVLTSAVDDNIIFDVEGIGEVRAFVPGSSALLRAGETGTMTADPGFLLWRDARGLRFEAATGRRLNGSVFGLSDPIPIPGCERQEVPVTFWGIPVEVGTTQDVPFEGSTFAVHPEFTYQIMYGLGAGSRNYELIAIRQD